jgi:hypothetical protein
MPVKRIISDGKVYDFQPGKGGSLTAKGSSAKKNLVDVPAAPVAKTVPCGNCGEPMLHQDNACSACGARVGSVRG